MSLFIHHMLILITYFLTDWKTGSGFLG